MGLKRIARSVTRAVKSVADVPKVAVSATKELVKNPTDLSAWGRASLALNPYTMIPNAMLGDPMKKVLPDIPGMPGMPGAPTADDAAKADSQIDDELKRRSQGGRASTILTGGQGLMGGVGGIARKTLLGA